MRLMTSDSVATCVHQKSGEESPSPAPVCKAPETKQVQDRRHQQTTELDRSINASRKLRWLIQITLYVSKHVSNKSQINSFTDFSDVSDDAVFFNMVVHERHGTLAKSACCTRLDKRSHFDVIKPQSESTILSLTIIFSALSQLPQTVHVVTTQDESGFCR